jgi:hypothetical protein
MKRGFWVNVRSVNSCGCLTVNAYSGLTSPFAFAHSTVVRLASAVVLVTPAVLDAIAPAFVTPFGRVFNRSYAGIAPGAAVAVSNAVAVVAVVISNHCRVLHLVGLD